MLVCALLLVSSGAFAQTPLWMRDPRISPDGTQIAFTYKGDLYKVSSTGGTAQRLTAHPAYDCNPVWSPDGKHLAFASDRNGNFDIFLMAAAGGDPVGLTAHSASEIPVTFSPDGEQVLFPAHIQDPAESALFPNGAMTELYAVDTATKCLEQILGTPAEAVCFSPDGHSFLYQDQKGFENEWRKHHTSSITRDIFRYDAKTGRHTRLTAYEGEDRNPVFSPDGKTVYFLSERKGSFNVFSFPSSQPEQVTQLTSFKNHPVRFLSAADNGVLCFQYDGELYVMQPGNSPKKVRISLIGDANRDDRTFLRFSSGASGAAVSPDGKQIALILRGEIFVTSSDYRTTKRITDTPEAEREVIFGPDNRTLIYTSERNNRTDLYRASIVREEDPNFPNATLIEEKALFPDDGKERACPRLSPDGKELAFFENRSRLMVYNFDTGETRPITDGSMQYSTDGYLDYEWSPDSRWFVLSFIGNRHDPYSDIGIVSSQGGPIHNITQSGYTDASPRWVLGGNAVLFTSERYGMRNHASWGSLRDVMLVFMNQDAYDKFRLSKEDYELQQELEKKTEKRQDSSQRADSAFVDISFDGMEDRIIRLTPNSSNLGEAILSKDGEKLYYMSAFESGYDMWVSDLRKHSTRLLHKLNGRWASFATDKEMKKLFLLGGQNMQSMDMASEKLTPIEYAAEMTLDPVREREYMYDRVCRQEAERFYTADMHGVDWPALCDHYRKFLPHINNNYDFAEMLSELLGELNVSHTGGRYSPSLGGDATAELGLLFAMRPTENGLQVEEVVENGPFDNARSRVKAGTVLEQIDGNPVTGMHALFPLLNKKAGKKTLASFFDPETGEQWEEVILPVSSSAMNGLLYKRWVKQRAAEVDSLSEGRLGYVHIQSMNDPSFRNVYADVLGKYNNREGIVIDTRFNGGGRLHEDIEVLFSGQKYLTQVIRGKEACDMPSRRWNKPSVMITCEANYSNAHGTPWVYKHRQIGKIVGMPVPGTMTSVSWEQLQDPSLVFGIPIIGYRLPDGSYLENTQLEPDITVANTPESVVTGRDMQLEKAVEVLLDEIDSNK